jgi:hypothetical protein
LAACIAVAFFNPDNGILSALARVPNLRLVISDDFQVNDPYKLESLAGNGSLRAVPADANARVEGPLRYDSQSPWWLFKRNATIRKIDERLPVDIVAGALNKGSLMQAIHKLEREGFEELVKAVWTNLGIKINI